VLAVWLCSWIVGDKCSVTAGKMQMRSNGCGCDAFKRKKAAAPGAPERWREKQLLQRQRSTPALQQVHPIYILKAWDCLNTESGQ
jgi:hypothetical protein